MICPICHRIFELKQSTALPFCSPRCRQIDLGRWLTEEYAVPTMSDDEEEGDEPSHDDDDLEEN
jgi:endogenous inhibitor of DNA gyrase (YacG/DUF329 family)